MSDTEDIDRLREQRMEELTNTDTTSGEVSPGDPIHVEGPDHLANVRADYTVVLVEFYADWCGPCQMMEPVLESLADATDAAVAKVDVDANQDLAAQYQVRGVPTIVLFADGDVAEQVTGARDEATLRSLIEQYTA